MTKIKLCGLSRPCDIGAANELKPDYIGFVFAPKSKRYVTPEKAMELKSLLAPEIQTVGVFVNEKPENIAKLLQDGIIDFTVPKTRSILYSYDSSPTSRSSRLVALKLRMTLKMLNKARQIIYYLIPVQARGRYLIGS